MKPVLMALLTTLSLTAIAHDEKPPELWSWFKDLNKSKEACEIQSTFVMDKLKVEDVISNAYGIYGNVKSNRVVVKCIAMGENASKLMVAVAGQNKDSVELVRNQIVKSIR